MPRPPSVPMTQHIANVRVARLSLRVECPPAEQVHDAEEGLEGEAGAEVSGEPAYAEARLCLGQEDFRRVLNGAP
eukprot:8884884-Alexandrium_andersonii.AAC.1